MDQRRFDDIKSMAAMSARSHKEFYNHQLLNECLMEIDRLKSANAFNIIHALTGLEDELLKRVIELKNTPEYKVPEDSLVSSKLCFDFNVGKIAGLEEAIEKVKQLKG